MTPRPSSRALVLVVGLLCAAPLVGCVAEEEGSGKPVEDPTGLLYPDIAALHEQGIYRTCSLTKGVCHNERYYPELGATLDMIGLVGAPCQLAIASPELTQDACEVRGDLLTLNGVDYEIMQVVIDEQAPFPPSSVTLRLAEAPPELDAAGVKIRRIDEDGGEIFSKALSGVTLTSGEDDPRAIEIHLAGSPDPTAAEFLDIRAWKGDRVRMGDPNGNGAAHAAPSPWSLVTPGDPARSFLYKRLTREEYGPTMPLIQRTWSAAATRALWCWIRGLPENATPASLDIHDPIDYAGCPLDPDAPDPSSEATFPAVSKLIGSRCSIAPCHAHAVKSGGLDLTPDAATFLSGVIQVQSKQKPGALLITKGEPASSYLFCKIDPSCDARLEGTRLMPDGGEPLSGAEIALLAAWIRSGAPVE